jgi:hypothetical protein
MKLSQKEIDFIYNNIDKLKEELANKYTTYTLQGKTIQLNAEQILLQSAKYLVDEEYSNSKQNSSIIANKEVLEEVGEILKDMSKNEYMQDVYLGRKTQALFTVTPEQYKNPDYDTDNSIGLTDSSATFVPTAKIGSVIGNATTKVTPTMIRKTGQGYDNLTLGVINQVNNVAPSLTSRYLVNPSAYSQGIDDIVNSILPGIPANTKIGVSAFGVYEMYNRDKETIIEIYNKNKELIRELTNEKE